MLTVASEHSRAGVARPDLLVGRPPGLAKVGESSGWLGRLGWVPLANSSGAPLGKPREPAVAAVAGLRSREGLRTGNLYR